MELVLPVLNEKDEERKTEIEKITQELKEIPETDEDGEKPEVEFDFSRIQALLTNLKKIGHAKRMFREGILVSLVSQFDSYAEFTLTQAIQEHPEWVLDSDKQISYRELLQIESLQEFQESIVRSEVSRLFRDSHYNLLKFLDQKLKLGLFDRYPRIGEFVEMTERRNLYVHASGLANETYFKNLNRIGIEPPNGIAVDDYLEPSVEYLNQAIDCFIELSIWISQAFLRRTYTERIGEADSALNNLAVELLSDERWELALRILDFALGIPKQLVSDGEIEYYYRINKCIALKELGRDFDAFLNSTNWDALHPKYHVALLVLKAEFKEALDLLKKDVIRDEIGADELKQWPLFRELRETKEFQEFFKEEFGRDFYSEMLPEEPSA